RRPGERARALIAREAERVVDAEHETVAHDAARARRELMRDGPAVRHDLVDVSELLEAPRRRGGHRARLRNDRRRVAEERAALVPQREGTGVVEVQVAVPPQPPAERVRVAEVAGQPERQRRAVAELET